MTVPKLYRGGTVLVPSWNFNFVSKKAVTNFTHLPAGAFSAQEGL
ncbi:MAG: hypothetical protein K0Q79_1302 [Flavipsychrobacter sp.]|jgi:hypothetical protein|nr:hypothetical protein [Flavipsychrobacter sp.]